MNSTFNINSYVKSWEKFPRAKDWSEAQAPYRMAKTILQEQRIKIPPGPLISLEALKSNDVSEV